MTAQFTRPTIAIAAVLVLYCLAGCIELMPY